MIKRLIFSLLAIITYLHAFAQPASATVSAFTASSDAHYCPALNEVTLDPSTRIWSAPGGWKSYETSFAQAIGQFSGAQWIGIEIGQVACIYTGKNQYTFPILLVHNKLIKTPEGGVWKRNKNDGHYHCVTHQISQCPFYPVMYTGNNSSKTNDIIDTIQHNPVQSQMNF